VLLSILLVVARYCVTVPVAIPSSVPDIGRGIQSLDFPLPATPIAGFSLNINDIGTNLMLLFVFSMTLRWLFSPRFARAAFAADVWEYTGQHLVEQGKDR
jgi:hypothetical protein